MLPLDGFYRGLHLPSTTISETVLNVLKLNVLKLNVLNAALFIA
jgi:hypothetical protein